MRFENQKNQNFQIPKKAHIRRFLGFMKIPKNAHLPPDPDILGIPKNAHLSRFSGFPKIPIHPPPPTASLIRMQSKSPCSSVEKSCDGELYQSLTIF